MAETDKSWVDGLTIGETLRQTAARFPDHDALVFPELGLRLSYAAFDAVVDQTAKSLIALGIEKGMHVGCWATNIPPWPILQMATARMGAVLVTINPAYRSSELEYVLNQGDIKALFLADRFKTSDYHAIIWNCCPELTKAQQGQLKSKKFPHLSLIVNMRGETPPSMLSWEDFLTKGGGISDEALENISSSLRYSDPINIQYTSGTTGFPKAAMLTHRNILLNAYYVTGCQNITDQDRMCIPVPYYHCFGLVMGTLGAVTRGAAMIIPAEYFDPEKTLQAVSTERATTLYGVPTMFVAMLDHPDFAKYDLSSLRSGIMAGSPCPIEVMRKVVDLMGMSEVTIAYGLTEASPVITQTRVDDSLDIRVTTVGRPLPGVEAKLIDPETGEEVGNNTIGELCTRGHGVMLGYYNNEKATHEVIDKDGWLRTGDLAIRYDHGNYSITGRIKDMVCRGGENIYPREIEEFLFTHPDIEQASVVGLPDPKYGEELCVWVQLHHGHQLEAEEVREFCRKSLAHYKVPRYVKFVDAFPQTVSGKIQKFKIREQMVQELGLEEQHTA